MIPGAVDTGPSGWAPLAMLAGFAVMLAVVLILRAFGRRGFKYGKERALPFYSGNIATERERVNASNFFWGFFEAFRDYYSYMKGIHTGQVNDYAAWFVAVASVLLAALALGVVLWA